MGCTRVSDPYVGRAQKLEVEEGGVSESVEGESELDERGGRVCERGAWGDCAEVTILTHVTCAISPLSQVISLTRVTCAPLSKVISVTPSSPTHCLTRSRKYIP